MTDPASPRPRRILLRSSWATANIGDVAHSPGAAAVLHATDPDAQITLWPCRLGAREREMFARHQPWLRIVDGDLDADGVPTTPELAEAWESADVLLHGSAAGISVGRDVRAWRATGRPYVFFGLTYDPFGPMTPSTLAQAAVQIAALPPTYLEDDDRALISGAEAFYCRDGLTQAYLGAQDLRGPALEWGPDATFAYDIRDDDAAARLLGQHDLTDGFLVAVPRSRFAPYYRIYGYEPDRTAHYKDAVNAAHDTDDMGVLAGAITEWVRTTGRQVLVGPEMSYAVDLAAEYFPRSLPGDVAPHVRVLSEYWDLPTATSVYARSGGVLSMDCHSPILAATTGTPAIYLRQPTETIKGQMYADLGAGDTVVEIETQDAPARLATLLAELHHDGGAAARERARAMHGAATQRLREMSEAVLAVDTRSLTGIGGA